MEQPRAASLSTSPLKRSKSLTRLFSLSSSSRQIRPPPPPPPPRLSLDHRSVSPKTLIYPSTHPHATHTAKALPSLPQPQYRQFHSHTNISSPEQDSRYPQISQNQTPLIRKSSLQHLHQRRKQSECSMRSDTSQHTWTTRSDSVPTIHTAVERFVPSRPQLRKSRSVKGGLNTSMISKPLLKPPPLPLDFSHHRQLSAVTTVSMMLHEATGTCARSPSSPKSPVANCNDSPLGAHPPTRHSSPAQNAPLQDEPAVVTQSAWSVSENSPLGTGSSLRSAMTLGSSQTNITTTTRSSVVTRRTSLTDFYDGRTSRSFSKSEDTTFTVDEAIDLYAAGFEDDVKVEGNGFHDVQRSKLKLQGSLDSGYLSEHVAEKTVPMEALPQPVSTRDVPLPTRLASPWLNKRDQYGFLKTTQYNSIEEHDAWSIDYQLRQTARTHKWTQYMRDSGLSPYQPTVFPARSAKTQRYIRKGIPPAFRGAAWFYYAGGPTYLARHPQVYHNLVKSSESKLQNSDKEAIERDLHRTFPDNVRFKPDPEVVSRSGETALLSALRRVLCAFALYNPDIGYCQSLNFIAGLLLLFLPEEKTFWMLHIITTEFLPGTHETSLEGANVDLWVLMAALKKTLPGVWSKIGAAGSGNEIDSKARSPPISLCTTSWFMSLFIGTLPIESVVRVWDVLFYEGSRTLFRVALTIFKLGERRIKAINDPMELFQVVQNIPRSMLDAGAFMDTLASSGGVATDWVDRQRSTRRAWFAAERQREAEEQAERIKPSSAGSHSTQGDFTLVPIIGINETSVVTLAQPPLKRKASLWRKRAS